MLKKISQNFIQNLLITFFLGLIAISLLSPIASNTYLPLVHDYSNHIGLIIQAKMALLEGQFPIRIAPWQFNGWRYPTYQFYSPLPYTVAAIIYRWLTPSNPFIAYKLTIWMALILGGGYIYRLTRMLTGLFSPALFASVVYMMAPYLIININVRGAFTEVIAQGIVPVVLYYTLRTYYNDACIKNLCLTSLSWFALAITHTITFIYSSLFIGLLLCLLTLQDIKTWKTWKYFIYTGMSYAYAYLLALWFIIPIQVTEKNLFIDKHLGNPTDANWLTPLSGLFSIHAVSPIPLPGNGQLTMPLYPAIGWCMLLAAGICFYYICLHRLTRVNTYIVSLTRSLLILFLLAVFAVWSPINFWGYLPKIISITQFSYRLLAQVMWTGALLVALSVLLIYKEKLKTHETIVGVLLIALTSNSWFHTNESNPQPIHDMIRTPDIGCADYLFNRESVVAHGGIRLPVSTTDNWLDSDQKTKISSKLIAKSPQIKLHLEGSISNNLLPLKITTIINGVSAYSKQLLSTPFIIDIPLSSFVKSVEKPFVELSLLTDKYFVPHDVEPHLTDQRHLAIGLRDIKLINVPPKYNVLPVEQVQPFCRQRGIKTLCRIKVLPETYLIQLPLLYYPKLLSIKVDGRKVPYFPLEHGKTFFLTGIKLSPGTYNIEFFFQGIKWANWISIISWIIFFLLLMKPFVSYLYSQRIYTMNT